MSSWDRFTPTRARECALWPGSIMEMRAKLNDGTVPVSEALQKIASLQRCDDRTPRENQLLSALRDDLETYEAEWSFD